MSTKNDYTKFFIILTEDDMKKLKDGLLVYTDATKDCPPMFIVTEEGFRNFQEFWGEEED